MEMWRPHLDQLRAWLAEPALLDEEDVTPPTAITIRNALWLALAMSERMFAPPLRVLPVPSGAIALERFTGDQLVRIELREDSDTVELFVFQGSQLITRALMRIDDVLIGATP
jgi:hypothetical protein